MDEFKFSVKCLVSSVVLVMAMQIHVSGATVENHFLDWINSSPVPRYLQKTADGAAKLIKNASKSVTSMTTQALGNVDTERASRLNIDFTRNPLAKKNQKKDED